MITYYKQLKINSKIFGNFENFMEIFDNVIGNLW